ncbi:MAG: hypothetical protein H7837_06820 [Magnetococcus sp. MYC-9]
MMELPDPGAGLVRLMAEQGVGQAQRDLEALIRSDPERVARWYVLARLLLQSNDKRQQHIQMALEQRGAEEESASFRMANRSLDAVQRLEGFLCQIRRARSRVGREPRAVVRAGLLRFLGAVRTHKGMTPTDLGPLHACRLPVSGSAPVQGIRPCLPSP